VNLVALDLLSVTINYQLKILSELQVLHTNHYISIVFSALERNIEIAEVS
jgi:hypothetical protein